jgi:hypothetical protein
MELSEAISSQLNRKSSFLNIPIFVAKVLGRLGDLIGDRAPVNSAKIRKITSDLTFNDDKARKVLNWNPKDVTNYIRI